MGTKLNVQIKKDYLGKKKKHTLELVKLHVPLFVFFFRDESITKYTTAPISTIIGTTCKKQT